MYVRLFTMKETNLFCFEIGCNNKIGFILFYIIVTLYSRTILFRNEFIILHDRIRIAYKIIIILTLKLEIQILLFILQGATIR